MNWKTSVTDPEEVKVFEALAAPNSTWRTVGGVSRQARLPEQRVLEILRKYNQLSLVSFSEVPSASGSALVTLTAKAG